MEYGEAVTPEALERAVAIGNDLLRSTQMPIRMIAALAVARTYCVCVLDGVGGGAADRRSSELQQSLIDNVVRRLATEIRPGPASGSEGTATPWR